MNLSDLYAASGISLAASLTISSAPSASGVSGTEPVSPGSPNTQSMSIIQADKSRPGQGISGLYSNANLNETSSFPISIDTFGYLGDDNGVASQASDFNTLSSSVLAIENYLDYTTVAGVPDVATRLSGRTQTYTGSGMALSHLAYTGGTRSLGPGFPSSSLRTPYIVTLGSTVSVGTNVNQPSPVTVTLTSAQQSGLGIIASTVSGTYGISWFTGCKLQVPTNIPSSGNTIYYDPCALTGRVEAIINNSTGAATLYLLPGAYYPTGATGYSTWFPNGNIYTGSPAGTPYLAPGLWYVWICYVLSPYVW